MNRINIISKVRSGIAKISLEKNREKTGFGTAFLVKDGIITNSHVIRPPGTIDAIIIDFENTDNSVRLLPENVYANTTIESKETDKDYVFIRIWEEEFNNRHVFQLGDSSDVVIGEQILFLGFPFGMPQLTTHLGYISSIHEKNYINIIQIDGSVNGGNSGGPLIDLKTGNIVGIVTRAVIGIIEEQFNQLISTLRQNQEILKAGKSTFKFAGIDLRQALRSSQAAMEQIARNLKRSANVGIGYAYSINYIRDHIQEQNKKNV